MKSLTRLIYSTRTDLTYKMIGVVHRLIHGLELVMK